MASGPGFRAQNLVPRGPQGMRPRVRTPEQGRRPLLAAAAGLSLAPGLPSEQNWGVMFRVCAGSVQIRVSVSGMRVPKACTL